MAREGSRAKEGRAQLDLGQLYKHCIKQASLDTGVPGQVPLKNGVPICRRPDMQAFLYTGMRSLNTEGSRGMRTLNTEG